MTSELTNLKKYLIENNITKISEIKNNDDFKKIIVEIAKELKNKNNTTAIEYIKRDMNILCSCGSGIELNWHQNGNNYFSHCKKCKKSDNSLSIKMQRADELIYKGEFLSLEDTISSIKSIENIEIYLGSGKQRKFIKEYNKLYFSILEHSKDIDDIKHISLRARILFLLDNKVAYCECGNKVKYFNNYNLKFFPCCKKCIPKQRSLKWYKLFYPDNFEEKFKLDREKKKILFKDLHTLGWYTKKYGDIIGKEKFDHHINRMLSNHTIRTFSKISQNLFNNIILYGYEEAYFGNHPKEKMFLLSEEYSKKLNQKRIFVDFCYKNKIIEFQGNYWHKNNNNRDLLRKQYLESIGYDVLFIYEDEYKEDNIREVQKCLRFLEDNKIQNRYKILTDEGYKNFDNIIKKQPTETIIFELENNKKIEVSKDHIFFKNKKEYYANDMIIGQTLQTIDGFSKIINIDFSHNIVYDVLETENHNYYANDILNHNCEFSGSSYTLISSNVLNKMKHSIIEELKDSKLKIYKYPEKNHKYIMTVDSAKDGNDAFSIQIVDITDFHFSQVATANLQIDYLLMPEFIFDWCEYYNNPYLIIENNEGSGQSIADQMLLTYEYENIHFDKDQGRKKRKKYPGFRTTSKTRKQILQTMKLFIENNKLEINDKDTISQLFQFVLQNNKYQADEGAHDDLVMSLAMVFVPFCNTKNFEDMKKLVEQLYNKFPESQDQEKVKFSELLNIGCFDDGTDEEFLAVDKKYIQTSNGYIFEDL